MPVFHNAFLVKADLETVVGFHRNAQNLAKVQPPFPRVISISCPPMLNQGDILEVFLGPFPKQYWKMKVEQVQLPDATRRRALMIDSMLAGPFDFWRHRHGFEERANYTLITDTIDFEPPCGKLGYILLPGVFLVLKSMFIYREKQTKKLLERTV